MTNKKLKKAFVILPITAPREQYDDLQHFHHVFDHLFKPSLKAAGFEPIFPETTGSEIIHEEIIKNLENAELVLCDMSLLNPNVFFELGIRTALNKPVCMVIDELTTSIPFDTKIISYHTYSSKLEVWELKEQIEKLTKHIKITIKKRPDSNALWNVFGFKIYGTKAEGEVTTESTKYLMMENELLKTKIEQISVNKKSQSSVFPEYGKYHKCSNCGYGLRIEEYMGTGVIGSENLAYVVPNSLIYRNADTQKLISCPSCGNVDSII